MITSDQIEEWIHEVEQRPSSAALIIRYISKRLKGLEERNEELLTENIQLRSGRRVEEYESRITNLEYQLALLHRQLGGDALEMIHPKAISVSLILYTISGDVIRLELDLESLTSGQVIANFGEQVSQEEIPRLAVTGNQEELLYAFDSGRTIAYPVEAIPVVKGQDHLTLPPGPFLEPRGEEELAAMLPVAKMSLFDYCLQVSRRGCIRKILMTSFESHMAKAYIGSGIKQKPDQMFELALARKDDHFVIVSHEGYVMQIPVEQMEFAADEALRLGPTDYLIDGFIRGEKVTLLVVTNNGKVINRDMSWVEQSESNRSHGQSLFSQARREAGIRVAGAAVVEKGDWCIILCSDGQLILKQISAMLASGSIEEVQAPVEVVAITTFTKTTKERE